MAGWQFGNQEEPSKPTKGERIEALEQAVKIQSRAIGEVERNLGRYDIAAMASAGKTLEQANANNSNTLARHSGQIGAIIRRLGVVEAEQRDIVACQDSQGDRLTALENRIGMGEASDKPAEREPFGLTGIPLYAEKASGEDTTVHRFEFSGTRGQVAMMTSFAGVVALGDCPADDRGISAIYGGDTEGRQAFIHVAGPDGEAMLRAWRNMLAYLSGDDLDRD